MNICFEYLYRDAGNNKLHGVMILKGNDTNRLDEIDEEIKRNLMDQSFFVPKDVGIEPLRFDQFDIDLDHDWHEYCGVDWTEEPITQSAISDIGVFLGLLKKSKKALDQIFERKR